MVSINFLPMAQQKRLEELQRDIAAGRVCVLIGAGVSFRSGMVDGPSLARALADGRGLGAATDGDLIATCDALEQEYGSAWLRQTLAPLLNDEGIPLSDAHRILARSSYAAYFTTNVDRLTEWALEDAGVPCSPVFLPQDAALLNNGRRPVIKIHGTIDHPHTMVFTSSEMAAFEGLMADLLRQVLEQKQLLIVGYRGTDPNFLRILDLVNDRSGGQPHVLIDFGREADRADLLARQIYLIDPGPGAYDRLPDVLGYLGGLDDAQLDLCRRETVVRGNPFPGLSPYGVSAGNFYGRGDMVANLCDRLPALSPVTVFFGDSGCGKTSLFQAGVLPELDRRGDAWALVATDPGGDPGQRMEAAVCARLGLNAGNPLPKTLERLMPEGRRLVVVIDQFERVLLPDMSPQADRFLSRTLPDLARRFGETLRVLIVLRSDALYRLHPYRDHPQLRGVYLGAEMLDTLTVKAAATVVRQVFLGKGFALTAGAVKALIDGTVIPGGQRVYLPYLQLLARALFTRLTESIPSVRTAEGPHPVSRRDVGQLESTDIILRHVRDGALALARIEPDRASVLKLYDLLTERHRRAILREDRLTAEFAEPDRVGRLLQELETRRLVHFDEILEGYELVHDSLVEPIRSFLDSQRVDFSRGDLVVLARRLFAGEQPADTTCANLVLYCLRQDLSPAWVERSAEPGAGWPALWAEIRLACPTPLRTAVWTRLALWVERTGQVPADLTVVEVLRLLITTRDPAMALALCRILRQQSLTGKDIETLWQWVDPDHADEAGEEADGLLARLGLGDRPVGALDGGPLRLGWHEVVAAIIGILTAPRRVPVERMFSGYGSRVYSEAGWWTPFVARLLERAAKRSGGPARDRLDALLGELDDDPELLHGYTTALLARPEKEAERRPDRFQRILSLLARRLRQEPPDRFLAVAEVLLPHSPKTVLTQFQPVFPELLRAGVARRAARLLALGAQEEADIGALLDRADLARDPEEASWLRHAALESPAEVEGEKIKVGEEFSDAVADIHWEVVRAYLSDQILGKEWCTDLLFEIANWTDQGLIVGSYGLMLLDNGLDQAASWTLWTRLWRLLCLETLRRGAAQGAEMPEGDPLTAPWPEVAMLWDQALEALWGVEAAIPRAAGDLDGRLRWLRQALRTTDMEQSGSDGLLALLDEWFSAYPDLGYTLRATWASTTRPLPARSVTFARLSIWCAVSEGGKKSRLDRLISEYDLQDLVRVGPLQESLETYKHAEDRGLLRDVILVAEEIIAHVVPLLTPTMPGVESFLWALIGRSGWVGLPGLTERQRSDDLIAALCRVYAGAEQALLDSLPGQLCQPDWTLRVMVRVACQCPDLSSAPLAQAIADVIAEGDRLPELAEALALLGRMPATAEARALLRGLMGDPPAVLDDAMVGAAVRSLLALSEDPEDRMAALEAALRNPVAAEAWEPEV